MLHFSRLKTALIIGVCLVGALLAVPNFIKPGVLPAWVPSRGSIWGSTCRVDRIFFSRWT